MGNESVRSKDFYWARLLSFMKDLVCNARARSRTQRQTRIRNSHPMFCAVKLVHSSIALAFWLVQSMLSAHIVALLLEVPIG